MCNSIYRLFGTERVPCEDKWGALKSVNKRFSRLRHRRESMAAGGFHSKECKRPK